MTPNPFRWVEIHVNDMERAKAFYQRVFNTELTRLENPEPEMWAFPMSMEISGAGGALVKIEGFEAGKNNVIPYFGCEECSVEQSRVEAAGGKIHKPKFSIGQYGFIALVTDTEGNMIGLHSIV